MYTLSHYTYTTQYTYIYTQRDETLKALKPNTVLDYNVVCHTLRGMVQSKLQDVLQELNLYALQMTQDP